MFVGGAQFPEVELPTQQLDDGERRPPRALAVTYPPGDREGAFQCAARNLSELFDALEGKYPGIRQNLCQADGTPQRFLNIYVNDEDIRFLGGAGYTFQDGDEVLLIPAIAGG